MMYKNLSVAEIIRDIDLLTGRLTENIMEICGRLLELRHRRADHPLMRDPMFRHFERVAKGRLIPALLWVTGGNQEEVDFFSSQTVEIQEAIARGDNFKVVDASAAGAIERLQPVREMSKAKLRQVFKENGGTRSIEEQHAYISGRSKIKRHKTRHVYADTTRRVIIVGGKTATLQEIKAALRDLGLEIVPAEARKGLENV